MEKLWSARLPAKHRRWSLAALNISLILLVFWSVGTWQARNLLPEDKSLPAPDFELKTLDGKPFQLHRQEGGAYILYLFTPWCTICGLSAGNRNSLPGVSDGLNSLVYAVALDWSSIDEVIRFAGKHDLKVPVLLGSPRVADDYRIRSFPTYYVLVAEKRVFHRTVGYLTALGMRWNLARARHPDFGLHFFNFCFNNSVLIS